MTRQIGAVGRSVCKKKIHQQTLFHNIGKVSGNIGKIENTEILDMDGSIRHAKNQRSMALGSSDHFLKIQDRHQLMFFINRACHIAVPS